MSQVVADEEVRCRDLLRRGELAVPRVCGQVLVRAVGSRGWERPAFAKGRRMFKRCGIPDPWDPDSPDVPLDLQGVGIPDRRVVAPHAAPPKATASGPAALNPRIPMPSRPEPDGAGKVAGLVGQTRRDDTAELKRKMQEKEGGWSGRPRAPASGDSQRIAQPVRPMPMRPDLAGGDAPGAGKPVGTARPPAAQPSPPRMSIASEPARGAPVPRPAALGHHATDTRPAQGERVLPPRAAPPVGRLSAPAPRSGGFRMAGTTTRASVVSEPEELPLEAAPTQRHAALDDGPEELSLDGTPTAAPPVLAPPPPPPARIAKPGGLDDLFGMGAEPTTRIRIPKAEPRQEGDARPRRPVVTDPATLVGGIDRRPPPPKPPAIKPSGGSSGGSDDLPDE